MRPEFFIPNPNTQIQSSAGDTVSGGARRYTFSLRKSCISPAGDFLYHLLELLDGERTKRIHILSYPLAERLKIRLYDFII